MNYSYYTVSELKQKDEIFLKTHVLHYKYNFIAKTFEKAIGFQ